MDEQFLGARDFFDFFGMNGVEWWFVEPQPRLLDGGRGAPLGGLAGYHKAVHFSRAVEAFGEATRRLTRMDKTRIDLSTCSSPDRRQGGRVVLIDDLTEDACVRVLLWWAGAAAALETSEDNFQVLLILPAGAGQDQAGWTYLSKTLAERFDGDRAAASGGQLHRFPGSPNYKRTGQPFLCRLVTLRCELDQAQASEQIRDLLGSPPPVTRRATKPASTASVAPMPGVGRDRTNSGAAMSWSISQVRRGVSDHQILAGLVAQFLNRHDPVDWPARTLQNAKQYLGLVPDRYRSS